MARTAAASADIYRRDPSREHDTSVPGRRKETGELRILIVKNLLFWGSVGLSLFGLYALVLAL